MDQTALGNNISPAFLVDSMGICPVEVGDGVNRSVSANDFLLSPNATPFLPSGVRGEVIADPPVSVLVPEAVSVEGNVVNDDGSPVLGFVNSIGDVQVLKDSDGYGVVSVSTDVVPAGIGAVPPILGSEEALPIANSLVEVHVTEVDTHVMANCVGKSSGLEIREQTN
ncbi:hypothetical protein MA16_Dca016464 [Dendrobium catenatum]|nr:hypothetical protein MA16_Dca016464 [Dendrobium catenatum]